MAQRIAHFSLIVRDYDEALAIYVDTLGLERLEDTELGDGKRWVRVRPVGSTGAGILLARAASERQDASVGNQTGGRVFVFLETDDFWRDYERLVARGVVFARPPSEEAYGTVAVFEARRAGPPSTIAIERWKANASSPHRLEEPAAE